MNYYVAVLGVLSTTVYTGVHIYRRVCISRLECVSYVHILAVPNHEHAKKKHVESTPYHTSTTPPTTTATPPRRPPPPPTPPPPTTPGKEKTGRQKDDEESYGCRHWGFIGYTRAHRSWLLVGKIRRLRSNVLRII